MKKAIECIVIAIVSAIFLSGCSGINNCVSPRLNFPDELMMSADSMTIADIEWWRFYSDQSLCSLIEKALEQNKDVMSAAAKVEQMQALYGVSRANQLPELTYKVTADNETNDYYGQKYKSDAEFDLKASLGWEVDFWGRMKWARVKSKNDYLASENDLRSIKMLIVAQVADAYFRLMALDNELAIVRRTLVTRGESMELAKLRFEGGLTPETVYQQAKVEYSATATLVPNLEGKIASTCNELAVLVGEYPGADIPRGVIYADRYVPDSITEGLPSTLLRRRPDLIAAENRLKAAMADVGITYANRFPSFNITLTGGFESDDLSNLLKSPFSYIVGDVVGPIFDMGRRKKKYKASLAAYDQVRLAYEKKVMEVFREVADGRKNYIEACKTTKLRFDLCDAAKKYVELATLQYRGGNISYLEVLDAQRRYFDAQIGLGNAIRDEHLSLVWLYKALGGGWKMEKNV